MLPLVILLTGATLESWQGIYLIEVDGVHNSVHCEFEEGPGMPQSQETFHFHHTALVHFQGKTWVAVPFEYRSALLPGLPGDTAHSLDQFNIGPEFVNYLALHMQPPMAPDIPTTQSYSSTDEDSESHDPFPELDLTWDSSVQDAQDPFPEYQ